MYSDDKQARKCDKAVNVIISSLGNVPLRVVEMANGRPATMLHLLDERFASQRAATRIVLMTSLYRTKYTGGSMSKHCDDIASIIAQLDRMGKEVALPESHKGVLLLASIGNESDYESTAAALRTRTPDELTFEFVAATLIDEEASRRSAGSSKRHEKGTRAQDKKKHSEHKPHLAASAKSHCIKCAFCGRNGHKAEDCYINPENPNNRLPKHTKNAFAAVINNGKASKKKSKKPKEKLSIAGVVTCNDNNIVGNAAGIQERTDNRDTLLDSGASAHIFGSPALVRREVSASVTHSVGTADGSQNNVIGSGSVPVDLPHSVVKLDDVLLSPNMKYNLISVGQLTSKGLRLIFEKDYCLIYKEEMLLGKIDKDLTTNLYPIPRNFMTHVPAVGNTVSGHL